MRKRSRQPKIIIIEKDVLTQHAGVTANIMDHLDVSVLKSNFKISDFSKILRLFYNSNSSFQLNGAEAAPATYSGSKMAAGRYQRAMQQFSSALQGAGLGAWLRKPLGLDQGLSTED